MPTRTSARCFIVGLRRLAWIQRQAMEPAPSPRTSPKDKSGDEARFREMGERLDAVQARIDALFKDRDEARASKAKAPAQGDGVPQNPASVAASDKTMAAGRRPHLPGTTRSRCRSCRRAPAVSAPATPAARLPTPPPITNRTKADAVTVPEAARIADATRFLIVVQEHAVGAQIGYLVAEFGILDDAVPLRDGAGGVCQHPVALRAPSEDEPAVPEHPFGLTDRQSALLPDAECQRHRPDRPPSADIVRGSQP